MFTLPGNLIILVLALLLAIGFVRVLNHFWPLEIRSANNQQVGWQLSVLGTTYAVALGFMLYTEWSAFSAAKLNVELEANSLRNIYRLASGLPQQQRQELQTESHDYAAAVISSDWPEMEQGGLPEGSHVVNEAMWKTLMTVHPGSASETMAADHALSELTTLTQHRRIRLLQSLSSLPAILWTMLLAGALLIIASMSIFGAPNSWLHEMQVGAITLFIVLVMLAIADINRPFGGWVHIDSYPFQRAAANLTE